ncbi:Uncharacterised protein [Mycobacteroides abscessus subsp. abscessus]|nr:Uncharacterised protein [Mycobacteroides abscessus subsp. abscessus]SKV61134.1 Uncharacterised protein [Mycobacteroides abscessus subsp. abscessus]
MARTACATVDSNRTRYEPGEYAHGPISMYALGQPGTVTPWYAW